VNVSLKKNGVLCKVVALIVDVVQIGLAFSSDIWQLYVLFLAGSQLDISQDCLGVFDVNSYEGLRSFQSRIQAGDEIAHILNRLLVHANDDLER
jgi:hypothetical protein